MDPANLILKSVVAALKADTAITGYVGTRVYDRPPHKDGMPDVPSPYISLGPHDTTSGEAALCLDLVSVTFQVDVWSWGTGDAYNREEAGNIASAVRRVLNNRHVDFAGGTAEIYHRQTRFLRDPDGTNHAAITCEAQADVAQ